MNKKEKVVNWLKKHAVAGYSPRHENQLHIKNEFEIQVFEYIVGKYIDLIAGDGTYRSYQLSGNRWDYTGLYRASFNHDSGELQYYCHQTPTEIYLELRNFLEFYGNLK